MLIPPADAQVAGQAASGGDLTGFLVSMAPIFLLMIVGYFLLIRPQAQKQKAFAQRIAGVKKGDQVTTGGGIVGRVTRVEDAHCEVEIAPSVRVRVVKATLTDIAPTGAKPAND